MAVFPFSAIVGQDDMKRALTAVAIDPTIGGVLIFGDRGTGKSTAVRALAASLPPIDAYEGCRYNCNPADPAEAGACADRGRAGKKSRQTVPVVDLPLGVTEDRVVGALDLERALATGEKVFEPGLLAKAHRGFLYIDEVNLLEDHIVDILLDVAASGVNVVEREGLSVRHPARFVIVGSGNPEEGELRPQLLDRFGLAVDVKTPDNLADRVEILKRRDAYERDRDGFVDAWKKDGERNRRRIVAARKLLPDVDVPEDILSLVAHIGMTLGTDGARGELTLMRTARAFAALEGRQCVTQADVQSAAPLALTHRLRRDPLDETGSGVRVARALQSVFEADAAA
ncbi:magnesium chelatase ATPase subunit I [Acuticoccus sp. MNP-M23]|uniref:magnesium chelatase ATPase subunit I n=1 Tax=Acuticoccus sp. MNP-M23 TaxID=3072793 RepID=UPI00281500A3|nr:magnesium chelatase ATPase subunit I [Acuticoccus sp. MNP-M23]WMS42119.1 magnesium chelatase ATPase subunit I [Acuticoccus sp. MNP-M23]